MPDTEADKPEAETPENLLNNDHGNYVFATFTGHIYDTTLDIYFAEARFYDADNRTWLAIDPVKDGLNWYQYYYSNPTTYYAPLGLWGTTTGSKRAQLCGSSEMNSKVISASGAAAIEVVAGGSIALSAIGGIRGNNGGQDSSELKNFYNSIKESPNYPEGFTPVQNGTTSNKVNNGELLEKLREIEPGTWKKVYKDGYDEFGNEISIHYFQSQSGKVFDVKVKSGWSN